MEIIHRFTGKISEIRRDNMIIVRNSNGDTRGLWHSNFHPNHRHLLEVGQSVQALAYYEDFADSRRQVEEFKVIVPQETRPLCPDVIIDPK